MFGLWNPMNSLKVTMTPKERVEKKNFLSVLDSPEPINFEYKTLQK